MLLDSHQITRLLVRSSQANKSALDQLTPHFWQELHRSAECLSEPGTPDHTPQPMALLHESYLRIVEAPQPECSRKHFFALAARAMRQVVVDYPAGTARPSERAEPESDRGGHPGGAGRSSDLRAMDEALTRLDRLEP